MLPSPREMECFVEAARSGNVSRAADRLGLRQSSVSQAILRLERALGAALFLRSKGGVRLTRAGERLLPQARALLDQWAALGAQVASDERTVAGRYTIGCHTAVGQYALAPFLPRLLADHPGLEIALRHDLSRRIADEVAQHRIDFGLVINPRPHPDLVIRELLRDRVTLWSRTGGPVAREVLLCDPDLLQTQAIQRGLRRQKRFGFGRQVTSSSLEVLAALARAGAGVAILPERVALAAGGLQAIGALEFKDRLCLVYRADVQRGLAGRVISRAIQEGLSG